MAGVMMPQSQQPGMFGLPKEAGGAISGASIGAQAGGPWGALAGGTLGLLGSSGGGNQVGPVQSAVDRRIQNFQPPQPGGY